jgi:hypothetical protein
VSSRPSVPEGTPAAAVADALSGWMPDAIVDRIAHRLRVPFLAVALVVGVLLMLPLGQVAPAGSDWLLTNKDAWGMGVIVEPGDVVFWILLVGLVAYDLVAMRWMRARTARTLSDIRDLAPGVANDGRDLFAAARDWRPGAIAATLYVLFHLVEDLHGGHVVPAEGIPFYVADVVAYFLRWFILASFLWMYAASLFGLERVCRQRLRLVTHLDDPFLGTRPLGRLSLAFAVAFYLGIAIIGLWLAATGQDLVNMAVFISVSTVGFLLFFLPLYSVHLQMVAAKNVELARSIARFRRIFDDAQRDDAEPHQIDLADVHAAIGWGFVDARVRAIHTWPFDTAIVVRLVGMFALPMVLAVLTKIAVMVTLGD